MCILVLLIVCLGVVCLHWFPYVNGVVVRNSYAQIMFVCTQLHITCENGVEKHPLFTPNLLISPHGKPLHLLCRWPKKCTATVTWVILLGYQFFQIFNPCGLVNWDPNRSSSSEGQNLLGGHIWAIDHGFWNTCEKVQTVTSVILVLCELHFHDLNHGSNFTPDPSWISSNLWKTVNCSCTYCKWCHFHVPWAYFLSFPIPISPQL